jgi:hypothetical protein
MNFKRLAFALALSGLFAYSPLPTASVDTARAEEAVAPLAVLMSCSGPVAIHRGDDEVIKGSFGFALKVGDEVKTGEGGSAEILFEAGNWLQIGANSSIQIKGQRGNKPATEEPKAKEVPSFEIAQNFLKLKDAEGTSALTGLRSGDKDQDLVALSPSQTKVRDGHPAFRWEIADPSTELRLTVYNDAGVHWQHDVSGATSLEYPSDAPELSPGVTYSWTLETTDPLAFPPLRTTAAFFEIIASEQTAFVAESLERINSSTDMSENARHFMRASLYFNYGLLDDAITETSTALEDDPENESLRTILARLYEEAGRTKEAMDQYKAIERN